MTTDKTKRFFRVSAEDFKKIPGSPIAYWVSAIGRCAFDSATALDSIVDTSQGMKTLDNERFIRFWNEISFALLYTPHKWVPINHGGEYRKWFGNNYFVVNWENNGYEIKELAKIKYHSVTRTVTGIEHYLQSGLTWTAISSSKFSVRFFPEGYLFSNAGMCAFGGKKGVLFSLALLNSSVALFMLKILSPTINFGPNQIKRIPISNRDVEKNVESIVNSAIDITRCDWDSYEASWDFQENPLWKERKKGHWVSVVPICQYYQDLRRHWAEQTEEMQTQEKRNNNIFIQAYGLQDELSAEVPWDEITLTCNPWYRYGKRPQPESSQETLYQSFECLPEGVKLYQPVSSQSGYCGFPYSQALEERLLADTMKEFISYAVGCMMGRYSLEKPGLILANQGEDFDDYIAKVRTGTEKQNEQETVRSGFLPDRDGVLPILDDEWFVDDIVAQFKDFLKFTFGEEAFSRNLAFIEKAIGKDIRKYFMKDFYKEHVQRYKKRPIYWLFSSPKGSFNALIYLHRYRPDTVSIVLNDYLREFMTKLRVQRNHLIDDNNRVDLSASEKSANLKRIDKYAAMLAELEDYERDILFPLAQKQLAIDLDDGVKVNYLKFGAALKEIPGLKAREE